LNECNDAEPLEGGPFAKLWHRHLADEIERSPRIWDRMAPAVGFEPTIPRPRD